MQFPTSYIVCVHTKDTTRTAKVEKLLPSVFFECQKHEIPADQNSRFLHNVFFLSKCYVDVEREVKWFVEESLHVLYERDDKNGNHTVAATPRTA